jgi:HEAT repeats
MAHRIALWLVLGLTLAPGVGLAARAERGAVLKLLGASERAPSNKELRALGDGVDNVLVAIANDKNVEPKMRARAVSALAFVPTAASRAYLGKIVGGGAAAKDDNDLLLIRRAAVSLGWQGGSPVPAQLADLLRHADADVRVDAALALALTRLPGAADLLRARVDVEQDARVRGHISRQLRVVESALGLDVTEASEAPEAGKEQKPAAKTGTKPAKQP